MWPLLREPVVPSWRGPYLSTQEVLSQPGPLYPKPTPDNHTPLSRRHRGGGWRGSDSRSPSSSEALRAEHGEGSSLKQPWGAEVGSLSHHPSPSLRPARPPYRSRGQEAVAGGESQVEGGVREEEDVLQLPELQRDLLQRASELHLLRRGGRGGREGGGGLALAPQWQSRPFWGEQPLCLNGG